jgi:hypothetical protein
MVDTASSGTPRKNVMAVLDTAIHAVSPNRRCRLRLWRDEAKDGNGRSIAKTNKSVLIS